MQKAQKTPHPTFTVKRGGIYFTQVWHTEDFSHTRVLRKVLWHTVFSRTQKSQNYTEFIRMAFCVFREFCVKHYTQELSHTDSTEIYSLHSYSTPHGARAKRLAVLCIPWILCEKFSHAKAQRTRNYLFFCSYVKKSLPDTNKKIHPRGGWIFYC